MVLFLVFIIIEYSCGFENFNCYNNLLVVKLMGNVVFGYSLG